MKKDEIHEAITILREEVPRYVTPAVTIVTAETGDPFRILISCILSLRTQDKTTFEASERLFSKAPDPASLMKMEVEEIEELIYPVGFYRNKARDIKTISERLVSEYSSIVPNTIEGLLEFRGVGRKTANLVVTMGYKLPGICVDIHVHRITNRWGYVETKNPDATETALRKKLPKEYWLEINDLLVTYGQNLCKPISPFCSKCRLHEICKRVGVEKSR